MTKPATPEEIATVRAHLGHAYWPVGVTALGITASRALAAIDALREAGDAFPTGDLPFPGRREGATYYANREIYARLARQTNSQRFRAAEQTGLDEATNRLVAAHRAEYDALVVECTPEVALVTFPDGTVVPNGPPA